jgi:small multidrug resistance family-3 protein
MEIIKSLFYFVLAGIFEIGGGYLVWLWIRDGKSIWYGAAGALSLIIYGVIPTLQPPNSNFGRVYAAYGGIFIILSILWGWKVDNIVPDKFDIIGGTVALVGVLIIMYYPRNI